MYVMCICHMGMCVSSLKDNKISYISEDAFMFTTYIDQLYGIVSITIQSLPASLMVSHVSNQVSRGKWHHKSSSKSIQEPLET